MLFFGLLDGFGRSASTSLSVVGRFKLGEDEADACTAVVG